jgi:xanthine/uracil/vitamin C permease (AzgA family)
VTFVTMAYIVILNPLILGGTKDVAATRCGRADRRRDRPHPPA